MLMQKGILIPYFETGLEITKWAFFEDDKEGYDGLHVLTEEHHIKVFDENNKIIYDEDIIEDKFSNYESYPDNPVKGQQLAGNLWVDWIQANTSMKEWLDMFSKERKVEVTKSTKSAEELKKIKEKIKINYFTNINFKKEVLLKPKLMFDINNPQYYQKEGEIVLLEQLMTMNFDYQIFDEQIYLIYVMQKEEFKGREVKISFIEKDNFTKITTELKKEKAKFLELYRYNKKHFSQNMKLLFKEDLTIEDQIFEKEFDNKNEQLEVLKEQIASEMFLKLRNAPKYILKGTGVQNTMVKFITFNKKDTRWLLKLKK
jgi:hypothetical protein